jgi:hypothetical protein
MNSPLVPTAKLIKVKGLFPDFNTITIMLVSVGQSNTPFGVGRENGLFFIDTPIGVGRRCSVVFRTRNGQTSDTILT